MMILVNCGCCCGVASGYGYAVWSTYGATGGVQGTLLLYCTRRSNVRHNEDENFGDNYFIIIFNRDLVRDQDEVYIYATLMEYKMSPAIYPTNSNS